MRLREQAPLRGGDEVEGRGAAAPPRDEAPLRGGGMRLRGQIEVEVEGGGVRGVGREGCR